MNLNKLFFVYLGLVLFGAACGYLFAGDKIFKSCIEHQKFVWVATELSCAENLR